MTPPGGGEQALVRALPHARPRLGLKHTRRIEIVPVTTELWKAVENGEVELVAIQPCLTDYDQKGTVCEYD